MKVFYTKDFGGYNSVGTAAVVVAETEEQARELMDQLLKDNNLWGENYNWEKPEGGSDYTLEELDISKAHAVMLQDGDY